MKLIRIQDLIVKHNAFKPEKGRTLIAEPFMIGEPFERSVILLCEKGSKGHLGFILNKPVGFYLDEIIAETVELPRIPIYLGGPVATKRLFFVHSLGAEIAGTVPVTDKLFMDGDLKQVLQRLAEDEALRKNVRFFLGYSGWTEGQLEAEIHEDSWLVGKISPEEVFRSESPQLWKKSMRKLGEKYRIWSGYPQIPSLN